MTSMTSLELLTVWIVRTLMTGLKPLIRISDPPIYPGTSRTILKWSWQFQICCLPIFDPPRTSLILMDPPWPSWTQHDLHGNTMRLIDPSLISRPSMNPTRTSLKPPWGSWTLHHLHGPNMTLMDLPCSAWTLHDYNVHSMTLLDSRPSLNPSWTSQTLNDPPVPFKTPCGPSMTLKDPPSPLWIRHDYLEPSMTLLTLLGFF